MKKTSLITLGILLVIFLVGLFFYHRLGGFKTPDITLVQTESYVIAGQPYKGKMTNHKFGKAFEEAEKHLEHKRLQGTLCGIFYNNPEKDTDSIDAFIGVILKDTTITLPEGYSLRSLDARRAIRAHIKAHVLVSPFIYPDIQEQAENMKVRLKHVPAIEIYPSDEEMIIEVPVDE